MTTESKIQQLENILKARLPVINRWNQVRAYSISETHFVVEWSAPKAKNIHPIETKEIPITDLNRTIRKNVIRLARLVKTYK